MTYSTIRFARNNTDDGIVSPSALAVLSRVEDWRGTFRPVSSPRHLKPGVPISGTGLSWWFRVMGYVTYRPGALSRNALLHLFQPKPRRGAASPSQPSP